MAIDLLERLRPFAEDTHPLKNTHLLSWLAQGQFHCTHGTAEWAQAYLDSAKAYIEAFEAVARAALASEPEPQPVAEWQDIASAPKTGEVILGAHEFAGFTVCWDDALGGWVDEATDLYGEKLPYPVTHWKPIGPLPASPHLAEEKKP